MLRSLGSGSGTIDVMVVLYVLFWCRKTSMFDALVAWPSAYVKVTYTNCHFLVAGAECSSRGD